MSKIKNLIETIPSRFRPERANEDLIVAFKLNGEEPIEFTVCIKNKECEIIYKINEKRDCLIETDAEVYYQIESGELNPQVAFFQGMIKIDNIDAMLKFSKMFHKFTPTNPESPKVGEANFPELNGPLKGVKVMDLSRLLPGPLLTLLMVQLGAQVYKVEDPKSLDPVRFYPPFEGNNSIFFEILNRGKISLKIPYFDEGGVNEILNSISNYDVFIEPFRPGVADKIGLSYEALKSVNPKLVYVSICGYGQDNDLSSKAGHDLNYLAHSGLLYHLVMAGLRTPPAFQMADIAGGSYIGLSSIIAALFYAEKTGKGSKVVVDMTAALAPIGIFAKLEGSITENYPGKGILSGIAPNYNIYECADGNFIALAALEPKFWKQFCAFFQFEDLQNMTFTNPTENKVAIEKLRLFFKEKSRDEWVNLAKDTDFCLSGIYSPNETINPYPLPQHYDHFLNPFRIEPFQQNKLWKFQD